MKAPIFSEVCTALVTPFLDGKVNYPMAKILLKRQMDAGIQACVLCGTTGEAPTLSDKEKYELIFQCKEAAGNDCVIIAGSGSNSTAHAIELSQQAEKAGADALLVGDVEDDAQRQAYEVGDGRGDEGHIYGFPNAHLYETLVPKLKKHFG